MKSSFTRNRESWDLSVIYINIGSKPDIGLAEIAGSSYYHPVLLSKETLYSAIKRNVTI